MKKTCIAMLAVGLVTGAQAQVLDLQTGRGASLAGESKVSVEGGVVVGDLDYVGARVNLLADERVLVGANLGQTDVGDNETAIGAFVLYQVKRNTKLPVAIKVGYDTTLDDDVDLSDLSVLAIVSGPIQDRIDWYANGGIHLIDLDHDNRGRGRGFDDDDDDVAPALGGGVVFTFNPQASAFAGIDVLLGDLFDDTVLGAGFRWSFR